MFFTAKSKRLSGIELLRIIAILQIIFLHLFQYGKLYVALTLKDSSASYVVDIMWCLSRTPVDVFVMISGYFLVTSHSDIRKTIARCGKPYQGMFFYSLLIGIIFFITTPKLFVTPEVFKMFLPFFSRTWYFLDNYIIILLISPFLNKMLASLNKKEYLYLMTVAFVVVSLWSTLSKIKVVNDVVNTSKITDSYYGKSLIGFLLMYIIGGYLRLFVDDSKYTVWKKRLCYILLFLLLCTVDYTLHLNIAEYKNVYGMFNNPFVLLESVCMILFFRSLHFSNDIINSLASTTLGIYAIHEHPYVREWFWNIINLKDLSVYQDLSYIPLSFGICIGIFVTCSMIEMLRVKLFSWVFHIFARKKTKTKP